MRVRVSGFIEINGRVLLVKHRKGEHNYWLLPGGGVSEGESLEEALIRELEEELSLPREHISVGDVVMIVDSISQERHVINITFEVKVREEIIGELIDKEYNWKGKSSDTRVVGAKLVSAEELRTLEIHPPINEELSELLSGGRLHLEKRRVYLGRRWKD